MKKLLIVIGIIAMFIGPIAKETIGYESFIDEFTRLYNFDQKFSDMDDFTEYLKSKNGYKFSNYIANLYRKHPTLYGISIDIDILNKFSSPLSNTYIHDFNLYTFKETIFYVYENPPQEPVIPITEETLLEDKLEDKLEEKQQCTCKIL